MRGSKSGGGQRKNTQKSHAFYRHFSLHAEQRDLAVVDGGVAVVAVISGGTLAKVQAAPVPAAAAAAAVNAKALSVDATEAGETEANKKAAPLALNECSD